MSLRSKVRRQSSVQITEDKCKDNKPVISELQSKIRRQSTVKLSDMTLSQVLGNTDEMPVINTKIDEDEFKNLNLDQNLQV